MILSLSSDSSAMERGQPYSGKGGQQEGIDVATDVDEDDYETLTPLQPTQELSEPALLSG